MDPSPPRLRFEDVYRDHLADVWRSLAALGVPKQEKWLAKHLGELGVPVAIGVGGTFDVMAGVMKRAPRWMQRAKLEWLFRGMMQPQRAGRLLALPRFVLKVHAQKGKK